MALHNSSILALLPTLLLFFIQHSHSSPLPLKLTPDGSVLHNSQLVDNNDLLTFADSLLSPQPLSFLSDNGQDNPNKLNGGDTTTTKEPLELTTDPQLNDVTSKTNEELLDLNSPSTTSTTTASPSPLPSSTTLHSSPLSPSSSDEQTQASSSRTTRQESSVGDANPAIYRDPPYGLNSPGPGDVIARNLKSAGGTTGNVLGQILRFLFGLPSLFLSLIKPLVVGFADTGAQTADAAAGFTKQAAQSLPTAVRTGAQVMRRLLEAFGDIGGGMLNIFSNLVSSIAGALTSLSGSLPFAFDIGSDFGRRLPQAIGLGVDFISGTKQIVSDGIVQATKTKSNLVSGIVEGAAGFSDKLLLGIRDGVNDESPPPPTNGGT